MLHLPPHYPAPVGTHPPLDSPGYGTTRLRAPRDELVLLPQRLTELTGPLLGHDRVREGDDDLTRALGGEALGQRIVVTGRVLDTGGRPIPDTLVEIWQANAAGRYRHANDTWPAPIDPHFTGLGRVVTDTDGGYRFTTVKPGAYPWGNHTNAWRPAHIHLSLLGRAFTQRLVTQMYFPDDPLFFQDPIYNAVPQRARHRLVSAYDHTVTQENWALGYRFDVVLRGPDASLFEDEGHDDA